MPSEFPYMMSITNVPSILEKIRTAGTPPKFTHDFLKSTLGFGSSNDRAIVKVLRQLGFLTADGTPTQRYNDYRGDQPGRALAIGLREGWPDFFLADERIYERTNSQIQGTAKSLTGAGDSVAKKMASTFKALTDKADWTRGTLAHEAAINSGSDGQTTINPDGDDDGHNRTGASRDIDAQTAGLFQLHHDIHLHLPPTTDVSVYRAILRAIKVELM